MKSDLAATFPHERRTLIGLLFLALLGFAAPGLAKAPWPSFTATTLTGKTVHSDQLVGQVTLLIVTPSRNAVASTRRWVKTLRSKIDQNRYRVRDVLAIDLPFFISTENALAMARKKVPQRYYDQTWLLDSTVLERELNIPRHGDQAYLLILDRQGKIQAMVHGPATQERVQRLVDTLRILRNATRPGS